MNMNCVSSDVRNLIWENLDTYTLLMMRIVCKIFYDECGKKRVWKFRFKYIDLVEDDTIVTSFDRYNFSCENGITFDKYHLINLHMSYPNLIYLNLRGIYNLPVDILDDIVKLKNLMFLDLYCSNIVYKLEINMVTKFLNGSPLLQEIDFAGECGLSFLVGIDGYTVDFMWDTYREILDKRIMVRDYFNDPKNTSEQNSRILLEHKLTVPHIDARSYPNIKSWDKCRFSVEKISDYAILKKCRDKFMGK